MVRLAVSVKHQDWGSAAGHLIVEVCFRGIQIALLRSALLVQVCYQADCFISDFLAVCADRFFRDVHDAFFPSGKTGCPRGFRSGSGSLPLRKTYPSRMLRKVNIVSREPFRWAVFFFGAVQILKAIAVV